MLQLLRLNKPPSAPHEILVLLQKLAAESQTNPVALVQYVDPHLQLAALTSSLSHNWAEMQLVLLADAVFPETHVLHFDCPDWSLYMSVPHESHAAVPLA